jgi:hypothetical protein
MSTRPKLSDLRRPASKSRRAGGRMKPAQPGSTFVKFEAGTPNKSAIPGHRQGGELAE